MSEKFQENVTVLKQQYIGKDIYDMTIQTKHIAGHAKAGQFVSLYSNDASKLLPRPISLCGIDAEAGTLRLVYRVTGEGNGRILPVKSGRYDPGTGTAWKRIYRGAGKESFPDRRRNRNSSDA